MTARTSRGENPAITPAPNITSTSQNQPVSIGFQLTGAITHGNNLDPYLLQSFSEKPQLPGHSRANIDNSVFREGATVSYTSLAALPIAQVGNPHLTGHRQGRVGSIESPLRKRSPSDPREPLAS